MFGSSLNARTLRAGVNLGLSGAEFQLGAGRTSSAFGYFAPYDAEFLNLVLVRPWWFSPIERSFHAGIEGTVHVLLVGLGAAVLAKIDDPSDLSLSITVRLGFP